MTNSDQIQSLVEWNSLKRLGEYESKHVMLASESGTDEFVWSETACL